MALTPSAAATAKRQGGVVSGRLSSVFEWFVLTVVVDAAHDVDEVGACLGRAHARHDLLTICTTQAERGVSRVFCAVVQ